jgi:hypothetical protein
MIAKATILTAANTWQAIRLWALLTFGSAAANRKIKVRAEQPLQKVLAYQVAIFHTIITIVPNSDKS